jgi:hypothetical protein
MSITLIDTIKTRAVAAAKLGPHCVNPYPSFGEAAALFTKYFEIERAQLVREDAIQISAAKSIQEHLSA